GKPPMVISSKPGTPVLSRASPFPGPMRVPSSVPRPAATGDGRRWSPETLMIHPPASRWTTPHGEPHRFALLVDRHAPSIAQVAQDHEAPTTGPLETVGLLLRPSQVPVADRHQHPPVILDHPDLDRCPGVDHGVGDEFARQ